MAQLMVALLAGCSGSSVTIDTGMVDTGIADTGPADIGPTDTGLTDNGSTLIDAPRLPDSGAIDAPPRDLITPDAADAPNAADATTRCTSGATCADNPAGAVCDTTTGRCVRCVPTSDTCPSGQYCVATTHDCAPGCRNDGACGAAASDGGASGSRRCDTATHVCVECTADDHCNPGMLCVGSVCVMGCNPAHPCAVGLTCCSGACVDTQTNVSNCGRCDSTCRLPNATPACMNGSCTAGMCAAPFADCDHLATNGCEVNTQTSLTHCGVCGSACSTRPHATATCATGSCAYACDAGFADCDMNPTNGCEADTRVSVAHCGACTTTCAPPNAVAACLMGVCALASCNAGFGDCDANPTNGCETDLSTASSHCGACGRACAPRANALSACAAGTCVIACLAGFADCDGDLTTGCEVDSRVSALNCGGCGRRCSFVHAGATCSSATCAIGTCADGYGNCDGMADNGCETALTTTPTNCGSCGTACPSRVCAAGVCQPPTCTDHVRNGTETDIDCGGGCPRCGLCLSCAAGTDCAAGSCSAAARCTFRAEVYIDWLTNCHGPGGGGIDAVVAEVPAGSYQVTALASGGTVWNPVSYPSTGWFWGISCSNFAVPGLTTPPGMLYPTAAAAFAALPRASTTASFAGGRLVCFLSDNPCSDNQGGVRFRMERTCP